ncbi:MAG: CPBP family intramembrane metalloprotease [Eubacteriales bacterium]|nr:CPBP family intramembrane metalloprotease [Eubacteriales bacterium]
MELSFREQKDRFNGVLLAIVANLIYMGLALRINAFVLDTFPAYLNFLENHLMLVNGFITVIISTPLVYIIMKITPADIDISKRKLSFSELIKLFMMCYAAMVIGNIVSNIFLSIMNMGGNNYVSDAIMSSSMLETLIFAVILGPIAEELVYRKLVIDRLLFMGEKTSVFMSALIFALMHENFYQFFYAFLVGFIFASIYLRTGEIKYTIVMHVIINFMGSIVVNLVTGMGLITQIIYLAGIFIITLAGIFYLFRFIAMYRLKDNAELKAFSLPWFKFVFSSPTFIIFLIITVVSSFLKSI